MEKILIVDDVETQCLKYERIAKKAIGDCQVFMANNGKDALEIARCEPEISVAILDINFSTLPEEKIISSDASREGFAIADRLREINPDLQIILTTCLDERDEPFVIRLDDTPQDIQQKIRLALRVAQLERENKELRRRLYAVKTDEVTIVGQSGSLMKVLDQAKRAAVGDDKEPILILGEPGTGKELLAKFIHQQSTRRDKPFVIINCAAIPDTLVEGELFGTERGGFTGGVRRPGKLELADEGILFFDEIGDMSAEMQAKLLRVLVHEPFIRVGGVKDVKPDIRFLYATNKDLPAEIKAGRFRPDLYSRLGALHLRLPPLRERKKDIPLLLTYFLEELAKEGKNIKGFSPRLIELFVSFEWAGNIRDLWNTIRAMAILSPNEILDVADLPENFKQELQTRGAKDHDFELIDEQLSHFHRQASGREIRRGQGFGKLAAAFRHDARSHAG